MDPKLPQPTEPTPPVEEPLSPGESTAWPRWQTLWAGQWGNIRVLAVALAIALTVRVLIAEPRYIPSNSMDPTLHIGDRLLVEKISYRWQPPHRGDIVVFAPPPQLAQLGYEARQAFIKRVIAEPGQTIAVRQGQVIVDGEPLQEPYILEAPAYPLEPVTVPAGQVFVMGDNRNDSNDSHVWGALPQGNIIGRARFRFWPLDRIGPVS
ncbi:signal peptidase I [Nodosilinea sp. PGN35]|uniref:signal peptidase I n=1 Tax=Nodosilinea sp. PGN35 TaxID=3020489 RepID=UPI0023B23D77|nr:signal peptidase I [Nodosilinea sp. TSF1-S3]MDF0365315.1 signal peptidase I [Nodosilinea sp. TSF1-S3]